MAASFRRHLQKVRHLRSPQKLQRLSDHHARTTLTMQDPTIARKSFKITGSILSNNTVTVPDPTAELKYCNLIGRYVVWGLCSCMLSFWHRLKNTFAFIFKLASRIGNLGLGLLLLIWRSSITLLAEMFVCLYLDSQNSFYDLR